MRNNISFEDVYRKIIDVNEALLSGKIDPTTALASHAGSVALSKNMSNEIKLYQIDLSMGKTPPEIGKRLIIGPTQADKHVIDVDSREIDKSSLQSISSVPVAEEKVQKTRKPRIGIVGLSPNQAGSVSSAFGEYADLEFWHDEGDQKLRNLARCDQVFVNLSQISHKSTGILDSISAKYQITGSGATSVKTAIKKWIDSIHEKS